MSPLMTSVLIDRPRDISFRLAWTPAAPCQSDAEYAWNYAASSLTGSLTSLCNSGYCGGHTAKGMLGFQVEGARLMSRAWGASAAGAGSSETA